MNQTLLTPAHPNQHTTKMILRFRTKDGMFRVNILENAQFAEALTELSKQLSLEGASSLTLSNKPGSGGFNVEEIKNKSISELGFKNGELLFLDYQKDVPSQEPSKEASQGTVAINSKQLELDDKLDKQQGLIVRKKTPLCRHSDKGMCEYCAPLPPWDKGFQEEHNIKHLSYHAYLNELNENTNKRGSSTSYISPLEEENFEIHKKCPTGHAPWPKGICSKCQPSAITLQQQRFRMVDHVEFADSSIINNFINPWRLSACQRFGIMFGKYDEYDKVPLGIKAKVEAIYEISQLDDEDGLTLQNWENEPSILQVASKLGLVPVGYVFTDLTDAGNGDGSVLCKRHKDSFFLSSLEVLTSAKFQNSHSNPCKWSDSGRFSSKFVTCVLTGNSNGEIDINAYQVSQAAEALVSADLISGSTHPSCVFIKKQDGERYVPEIFYKRVNEYGIAVKVNANPHFPVEYLIVSLTHGFPQETNPLFQCNSHFAVENRGFVGESQDLPAIKSHFQSFSDMQVVRSQLSDFHLLCYLCSESDVLSDEEKQIMLQFVKEGCSDDAKFYHLVEGPGWMTMVTILQEGF